MFETGGLGEAGLAPNYTQDLAAPAVGWGGGGARGAGAALTAGLLDVVPAGVKSDPPFQVLLGPSVCSVCWQDYHISPP